MKPQAKLAGDADRLFREMLGVCIRERRRALGLNQRQFAEKAGISRSELQFIENAHRDAKVGTLRRVCHALGDIFFVELTTEADRRVMQAVGSARSSRQANPCGVAF